MRKILLPLSLLLLSLSCSRTPGYVISEDKMASLMVDLYVGDAVVEAEGRKYATDSSRLVLLQSIYARHGVTREQVDTSLQWYGNHIQVYMDVCNSAEELLQKRIENVENAGGKSEKTRQGISIDGDSVDVWSGERYRRISGNIPGEYITFSVNSDKNWDRGDCYTLSMNGFNTRQPVYMNMAADYNDGTTEISTLIAPAEGPHSLRLVLDSAKVASTVYGYIRYAPSGDEVSYIDSIRLVRTRGNNDNERARRGQVLVHQR